MAFGPRRHVRAAESSIHLGKASLAVFLKENLNLSPGPRNRVGVGMGTKRLQEVGLVQESEEGSRSQGLTAEDLDSVRLT